MAHPLSYQTIVVDGLPVFYRDAPVESTSAFGC